LDVTREDAAEKLNALIDQTGSMDLFLLSSGIGFQNMKLDMEVELNTARTNVEGFTRMVDTTFAYFKKKGGGHLAVISSIAGTKGLGVAPAYSATFYRTGNNRVDDVERITKKAILYKGGATVYFCLEQFLFGLMNNFVIHNLVF